MILLQKYHFLKKQAGDTPILFSLPSFLFVISQYTSYVRIKVKGMSFNSRNCVLAVLTPN